MKEDNKNKKIKILIASLLCGLTFAYVNANAMKDSDKEKMQQEWECYPLDSYKINESDENKSNAEKKFNELYNETTVDIKRWAFKIASSHIQDMNEILEKEKKNIDTNTVEIFNKRLEKIIEIFICEMKKFDEKHYNYTKEKISKIDSIETKKYGIIEVNQCEDAAQSINLFKKNLEASKTYLDKGTKNYLTERIKELHEDFEMKIMSMLESECADMTSYINHHNGLSPMAAEEYKLSFVTEKLNKIINCKEKYVSCLSYETNKKFDEKIREIKEKIRKNMERKSLKTYMIYTFRNIRSLINSAQLDRASREVQNMEKLLKNKIRELELPEDDVDLYNGFIDCLSKECEIKEKKQLGVKS